MKTSNKPRKLCKKSFLALRNFRSKHSLDYYFNASCVTHTQEIKGENQSWQQKSTGKNLWEFFQKKKLKVFLVANLQAY